MQEKIAVLGGGSWGTALANLLAGNGFSVDLYVLEKEVKKYINEDKENKIFLKGIKLNEKITACLFDEITGGYEKFVWVVPTQFSGELLKKVGHIMENKKVIAASKGIEIENLRFLNEIFTETVNVNFSVLSGPSFAKEVAIKKPTAVSIASENIEDAKEWQKVFSNEFFRCYATDDVVGVEVGGALKNVIAIATGISDGLGFGHNARAGLITRGLREITRLGIKMGGKVETFMGLSGMGDLVLTCTGDLSRNRSVGLRLGKGEKIDDIVGSMKMVAEGVYTVKAAYLLARNLNIEMPITEEVYKIIYEKKDPKRSFFDIMNRPLKEENV